MRAQFSVENTGGLTGPARDTIRTASYANSMRVLLIVAGLAALWLLVALLALAVLINLGTL